MPYLSKRGHSLPSSPIRKLVPFAEKAKASGKKILQLNIGQPDIETPSIALSSITNLKRNIIEYSHTAGFHSYREKLVLYYNKFNIDADVAEIVVTTGGSEAIIMAFIACLDHNDEIIIPEPFYANYNGFAKIAGINVKPVTSCIEDNFSLPGIDAFEKLITKKTKAILICNPNNPTGYFYKENELSQLIELIKKYDLFLIADEVYREFVYDGQYHRSLMTFPGVENNVVLVDSISKRYSACGARVGTLITKNKDILNVVIKYAQARLSPPTLGQILGEAALDTPANYFQTVIKEYIERRDLLVEGLNKINGILCPKPGGAFYAMLRLPVTNSENFCKWMLESFSYNNYTVMLAPGNGFYISPGKGLNEVRIAYVLNKDELNLAIQCIKLGLEEYSGT